MGLSDLVKLTSKAWAIPILAQFGAGVPGRQAPLLRATGASRTAFGQSLTHLQAIGVLERNPSHGHPLRPEFRLTEHGKALAAPALAIHDLTKETPHEALIRRMWVLPLLALTRDPRSFSTLASALRPITDRALSQALQRLQTAGWIHRDVDITARPPRATYQAQQTGAQIGKEVLTMLQAGTSADLRETEAKLPPPRPTLG